jgi:hypothetical protein
VSDAPVVLYDDRIGPDPVGRQQVGLNGFVLLQFENDGTLAVRYYDRLSAAPQDFLLEERWQAQQSTAVGVSVQLGPRGGGPDGLKVVRDLEELGR